MMLLKIIAFVLLFVLFGVILLTIAIRSLLRRTGLDKVFRMFTSSDSTRHADSHTADRQSQHTDRQTTTPHGDIIIDRRNPEKAHQKIFEKSEGEYVDYREE